MNQNRARVLCFGVSLSRNNMRHNNIMMLCQAGTRTGTTGIVKSNSGFLGKNMMAWNQSVMM
jgi:hypothetical protein